MTDPAPPPASSSAPLPSSLLRKNATSTKKKKKTPFEVYFLATLLGFALISVYLSTTTTTQKQQQQRFFSEQRRDTGGSSRLGRSRQKQGDENKQNNSLIVQQRAILNNSKKKEQAAAAAGVVVAKSGNTKPEDELYTQNQTTSSLAGLDCSAFGGPSAEFSQEMVYWHDIPSDNRHVSPFRKTTSIPQEQQYLTFEPDEGGFNNIRMAMETVLALAFAMGRTLVLPPENKMYLLGKSQNARQGNKEQRNQFSFAHFFHMEAIHNEHVGLDIITMDEFLQRQALSGHFHDVNKTNQVVFPPENRTNWNGSPQQIFTWLRKHARNVIWTPEKCMAVFPASPKAHDVDNLLTLHKQMRQQDPKWQDYVGKPVPVNASTMERMKEHAAERHEICIYDEELQAAQYIHFPTDHKMNARLLVHSYAFLFFEDWKQDLWMKRFIRDHVRYIDEIQCAAARVVQAIRERAKNNNKQPPGTSNPKGLFDTIHIRREVTRIDAEEIYQQTRRQLKEGTTLYVATDEHDQQFFDPLRAHYDIVFLNDFHKELGDLNTNYYGMVDQLVSTRGETFFGCWFSTFTGYITRLRGYHADAKRTLNYEQGVSNSWYYVIKDRYDAMQSYQPIKQSFWAREFPTSWRLIDTGVDSNMTTGGEDIDSKPALAV